MADPAQFAKDIGLISSEIVFAQIEKASDQAEAASDFPAQAGIDLGCQDACPCFSALIACVIRASGYSVTTRSAR